MVRRWSLDSVWLARYGQNTTLPVVFFARHISKKVTPITVSRTGMEQARCGASNGSPVVIGFRLVVEIQYGQNTFSSINDDGGQHHLNQSINQEVNLSIMSGG